VDAERRGAQDARDTIREREHAASVEVILEQLLDELLSV
jgi:hypothetical protein